MPAKIQEVTTSQKLIKKFALVGQISPQLDETIVPVVVLDDLTDSEEWRFGMLADPRGDPGVGNFNTWSIGNPANSGHVVQLLSSQFSSPNAQRWIVHHNNTTPVLATPLGGQVQDLRGLYVVPNTFPVALLGFEALGAALGVVHVSNILLLATTVGRWAPERLLIYPNERLFFQQQTANTEGGIEWTWRERPLRTDGS